MLASPVDTFDRSLSYILSDLKSSVMPDASDLDELFALLNEMIQEAAPRRIHFIHNDIYRLSQFYIENGLPYPREKFSAIIQSLPSSPRSLTSPISTTLEFYEHFIDLLSKALPAKALEEEIAELSSMMETLLLETPQSVFELRMIHLYNRLIESLSSLYPEKFYRVAELIAERMARLAEPSICPEGFLEIIVTEFIQSVNKPSDLIQVRTLSTLHKIHEVLLRFQDSCAYHTKIEKLLLKQRVIEICFEGVAALHLKITKTPLPYTLKTSPKIIFAELKKANLHHKITPLALEIFKLLFSPHYSPKSYPLLSTHTINYLLQKTIQSFQILSVKPDFPYLYFEKAVQRLEASYSNIEVPIPKTLLNLKAEISAFPHTS